MASGGKKEIDNEVKLEVRAVLLSKIGGILLKNFQRDFMNLLDHPIRYRDEFGFNTLADLLRAMPDVVRFVYSDANQDWRMFGVGDNKSFMSKHAKMALGRPGEDVDKFEGKKSRRGGRLIQNRRQGGPFRTPYNGRDRNSTNPRGVVPQKTIDGSGIEVDGGGTYPICCPLNGRSQMDVLAELKTVAQVVSFSLSNSYLFTRFSSHEDAVKIMKAFKTKFGLRPVENRGNKNRINTQPTTLQNGIFRPPKTSQMEIYIGNIPERMSESDIRQLLDTATLVSLRIKSNDTNGKRFAFGGFNCQQDALLTVQKLNGKIVQNRRIICRLAHPDPLKAGKGIKVCRVDMDCLMKLVGMGFPYEGSRRALYHTGTDLAAALTWIKQHQDDPDFNTPFTTAPGEGETESNMNSQPRKVTSPLNEYSTPGGFIPDIDALKQLSFIGVPREQAIAALKAANNDLQDASEWLIKETEELLVPEKPHVEPLQKTQVVPEKPHMESLQKTQLKEQMPSSLDTESNFVPDQKCLADLITSGINEDIAYQALKTANNDLDQAAVWLMENSTELQSMLKEKNVDIPELISTAEIQSVDSITEGVSAVGIENGEYNQRILDTEGVLKVTIDNRQGTLTVDANRMSEQVNGNIVEECNYDDLPPLEIDDEPPELEYENYDEDYFTDDSQSLNLSESESSQQHVPIYVGKFPSGTKQLDLLELFSEYRPIKIKMINNSTDSYRKTFAFVVLGNGELAESAIEEMNGALFEGCFLQVGRAFLEKGYNEPVDEPATLDDTEDDLELTSVPESVSFYHTLLEQVWPCAKILSTELFGRLPVDVTCVVDDHYFFGHMLKFTQEGKLLEAINTELDGICSVRSPDKRLPEHRCCARYEGSWYRAYNMGSLGAGNTQAVMFLDYGNLEQLAPTELRRPFLDLFEYPPVTKAFELVGSTVTDKGITVGSKVMLEVMRNVPHELVSVTRVRFINTEVLR